MDRSLTYPDIARIFGTALIATGLGLLLFVAVTVTWGDPFTRLTASSDQKQLAREFAASAPGADELTDDPTLDPALTRRAAALDRKQTAVGDAAGKISIPRIGMHRYFVKGAGHDELMKGPGLYREVLFPGSGRPVAIAGHRTTYGAPFLDVDKLRAGDAIVLTMPYGRFTYRVTRTQIIEPDDWSIILPGAAEPHTSQRQRVTRTRQCIDTCEHLVLTACHPKYSAAKRIAVFAKLSKVQLDTGATGVAGGAA
jgi:sortase A